MPKKSGCFFSKHSVLLITIELFIVNAHVSKGDVCYLLAQTDFRLLLVGIGGFGGRG